MPSYQIVATGLPFGEGPAWCADGTIVCTSVAGGRLYRVFPEGGDTEVVAVTDGGPNSCAPAVDGGFLVTQNGGVDFSLFQLPGFGDLPACKPVTPGIQYVSASGDCRYLASHATDGSALRGPNDLTVAADGSVYFTDPGHYPLPEQPSGRVMKLDRDGEVSVVAGGFSYCNGIALDRHGALVIVEGPGLMRLGLDGGREWIIEQLGAAPGDGFCFDVEGNAYVCCSTDHCIRVIDPDGIQVDVLLIDGPGLVTNCCFGGADGRSLFATDAIPGHVLMWSGLPHAGLQVHHWPGLAS
jgi:sugar lactone lactonase YvrE